MKIKGKIGNPKKNYLKKSQTRQKNLKNKEKNPVDQEADDEHSDWPGNEKTSVMKIKKNDLTNNSSEISKNSLEFRIIPWWEEEVECTKNDESTGYFNKCLMNSNYNIINQTETDQKSNEFDEILNGALVLMSSEGQSSYKKSLVRS